MERQIMWSPWTGPGLEHLHLRQQQEDIVADGLILGVEEHVPFRVHYEIHCDPQWRLRSVNLSVPGGLGQALHFFTGGDGSWTTESREAIPSFKGCLSV